MQSRGAAKHRDFDRSLANSIKPLPSPPRRRRLERGRADHHARLSLRGRVGRYQCETQRGSDLAAGGEG
jgi:hypothetical protein